MRIVWTFVKVVIGLAIGIPLAIIMLGTAVGVLGALIGLAVLALKLAFLVLLGVGGFRLLSALLRGRAPRHEAAAPRELPAADPHYEAAMRELDAHLGEPTRR